jgi:hypothetical protein
MVPRKTCPNCGAPIDPAWNNCPRCGAQVRMPVSSEFEGSGVNSYPQHIPAPGVSYYPARAGPGDAHVTAPAVYGDRPTAAFVLSLIAGAFILINGITIAMVGSFLDTVFEGGLVIGAIGAALGVGVLISAILLSSDRQRNTTMGAVILILSLVSIIIGGGFFIGLLLGVVGGIMAIVWRP